MRPSTAPAPQRFHSGGTHVHKGGAHFHHRPVFVTGFVGFAAPWYYYPGPYYYPSPYYYPPSYYPPPPPGYYFCPAYNAYYPSNFPCPTYGPAPHMYPPQMYGAPPPY